MGFAVQVQYPMVKVTLYPSTAGQQWNGINRNPHGLFSQEHRPSGWKASATVFIAHTSHSFFHPHPESSPRRLGRTAYRNVIAILVPQTDRSHGNVITHAAHPVK